MFSFFQFSTKELTCSLSLSLCKAFSLQSDI